ncbi:3-dehydrosphinganine reductase TSC10A [Sesamum alatum]|uniref:3-dehydrosphinganine reductase TSC10A n=1 Tax=Sesamum alatum TaxID=300844 RepID=A0AAE1Y9L5_9LAMI|nr:3-dehydrosphinganine reductase TSC10A [Sesamum alatum]
MADVYSSLLLLIPLSLLLHFIVRPRPVMVPIKNRHVLITGGSSGIGLALAHLCAREGANVTILARDVRKLKEAKQSIKLATGREVSIFSADVRDHDAVERVIRRRGTSTCSAGIGGSGAGGDKVHHRRQFDGDFHLIKAALPGMKKCRAERGPGSIAIMSSQAGQVGIYGLTAYSASKFGLKGLAEALQHEIIADNIHVSLIFPPDTETPGFVRASSGAMKADEVAKKSLHGIQSGAFIVPCNFEGFLLSVATAGLSPQRSYLMAFVEVTTAGTIRLTALFFLWNWYRSIKKLQLADKIMSIRKNT